MDGRVLETYRETEQQAGLAHARVSDEEQFEQVVAGREKGRGLSFDDCTDGSAVAWGDFFVPELGRVCVAHSPGMSHRGGTIPVRAPQQQANWSESANRADPPMAPITGSRGI